LRRHPAFSPEFFGRLLEPADAVAAHDFADASSQCEWVANDIKLGLNREELEASDFLVIFPDARRVVDHAGPLIAALLQRGIKAHIAGVTTSQDQLFVDDSVAISGIYRAKGNEAPVVYIMNAEYCYSGFSLPTKRNTLFTAITRSRAWVRVCGIGESMM